MTVSDVIGHVIVLNMELTFKLESFRAGSSVPRLYDTYTCPPAFI